MLESTKNHNSFLDCWLQLLGNSPDPNTPKHVSTSMQNTPGTMIRKIPRIRRKKVLSTAALSRLASFCMTTTQYVRFGSLRGGLMVLFWNKPLG